MQKTCSKCSEAMDADAVFCVSCGTPVLQTIHCPKCGGVINANVKFCKYCAFDLSQPISSAASSEFKYQDPSVQAGRTVQPNTETPSQTESAPDNPASYISPAGAAFAVICFFMPWAGFSACGISKDFSGSEIASYDGSLWLVPLMGIVSIGTYFFFKNKKMLFKARPFIIGSSALALLFLFYKYNSIPSGPNVLGHQVTASDFGIQLRFGSVATIIGFMIAVVGCVFMSRAIVSANQVMPTDAPTGTQKYKDALSKDVWAAVLSYLGPLLLPIVLYLILTIFSAISNMSYR